LTLSDKSVPMKYRKESHVPFYSDGDR